MLVAVALASCTVAPAAEPAMSDTTSESQTHGDYCATRGTFCAGISKSCNGSYSLFCAEGLGWCTQGVCQTFCSSVSTPHCPAGQTERIEPVSSDKQVCTCIPSA